MTAEQRKQLEKELVRVDLSIEMTVASVHGVLTAAIIERRSELRRALGISDA
jgi:hypothetical protein